ncbi:MAG TPA: exosortase-associated EpsI family protein [Verrucomicrobiae bacterium]|nr:exosortase-associated EpsI family protein [Verrucomicrobiae bacterium]
MNRRKLTLAIVAVVMIAGAALLLAVVPQKLGRPGVRAAQVPDSPRMRIDLPETILGFSSTNQEPDAGSIAMLPADTSFGARVYFKRGELPFVASVVLMGTDRTSIHKAEYCLQGQGLHIDQISQDTVHMTLPRPYDLPVIKILASDTHVIEGREVTRKCVYVYWYVTDGALSNDRSGVGRMWAMTKKLLFTGVLQRWAYVRFYTFCEPGQEDATYESIKHYISVAVPQFQTTPGPADTTVASKNN